MFTVLKPRSLNQLKYITHRLTNTRPTSSTIPLKQSNEPFLASWKAGGLLLSGGLIGGEVYRQYQSPGSDISNKLHSHPWTTELESNTSFDDIGEMIVERIVKGLISDDHITFNYYYKDNILALLPRMFFNKEKKQGIEVHYIGTKAVDHDDRIHQGILTHMLDEAFYRVAVLSTSNGKNRNMFTVNLSTEFNAEGMKELPNADTFVKFIIDYEDSKSKPYKAVLSAKIFNQFDELVGTAECTYVIPKDRR
ncbi:hypothetical protein K502DRAFT_342819 [Neoconidiobolus thromboides FSU 785]|nr:hypothetical protein K502DRAFT_342819 [Neoconidiobolus thromboides FSU 785]